MKVHSHTKIQRPGAGLVASIFFSVLLLCGSFCPPAFADLPAGWTDLDIGSPSLAGSASDTNGGWTVAGGGGDIQGTDDQFNFVSENVTNDQCLIAEVLTDQNTSPRGWSKAGVMFRNDASAGAVNAAVVASVTHGVSFQWRSASNGDSSYMNTLGLNVPIWVKLVRTGTNFSAFYSTSGISWIQVGTSQSLPMNTNFQAGFAVTAHNDADLNTSTFTNLSITALATVVSPPVITSEGFSSNSVFLLGISGVISNNYVLQATTNFADWVPISTNLASTNLFQLVDPNATNFPYRYYRVLQQ